AELEQYVEQLGIKFEQDESNFDDFALRNRVRNTLIPALEKVFERDVAAAVLRAAERAARDDEWMSQEQGKLPRKEGGLDVALLRTKAPAMRDRLILYWLRENRVPDCGFDEVVRVSSILLTDDKPAKVNLPGNHYARRRAGVLFLESD
ncbi:MAG: TilS substrate-binding domain-containing protein, partial [Verrucomicrobiota bacterium]